MITIGLIVFVVIVIVSTVAANIIAWRYDNKLWNKGIVPSFDGTEWRLHGEKNAKILWQGKV